MEDFSKSIVPVVLPRSINTIGHYKVIQVAEKEQPYTYESEK